MEDDDPEIEQTQPAAQEAEPAERRPTFASRLMDRMRPRLHRAWVNIRVWVPWLLNPFERKRMIRYNSRDNRIGFDWTIDLPVQCWKCGEETDLKKKKFSANVRCFEYPVQIVLGAIGTIFFVAFPLSCISGWYTVFLTPMVVAMAALLIKVKSWPEHVDLLIWSCPEHRHELEQPELVAYDEELHVSLPTAALAKAARTEQQDRRRGNRPAEYDRPPKDEDG